MIYQQTRLSDFSAIGAPGPLPDVIATWGDAPDLLADLTGRVDPQFRLDGIGLWPVNVTAPSYDPTSQVLVPPIACDKADLVAKRWTATATVRAMTAAELAAANPPVTVTGNQWAFAISDLGLAGALMAGVAKSKASDQHRYGMIARDTPLLVSDPLLVRICANTGGAVDVPTVHAHARTMPF